MIQGYDEAISEIQTPLSHNIMWFTPPEEKNFDPSTLVVTFAGLLVTSFLAGFVEEARKSANIAGKKTFRKLADATKSFFAGNDEYKVIKDELNQSATEATVVAQTLTPDKFQLYAKQTENDLSQFLAESLPEDKANSLAVIVRQSTVIHILSVGK